MIGNVIQSQFGKALNWPMGAALSVMAMLAVTVAVCLFVWLTNHFKKNVA